MKINKKLPAPCYKKVSVGTDVTVYKKIETLSDGKQKLTEVTIDDSTGKITSAVTIARAFVPDPFYDKSSSKEFNLAYKSWLGLT